MKHMAEVVDELRARRRGFHNVLQVGMDGMKVVVMSPIDGKPLIVIASTGGGWDHVSVSHQKRVPNWYELEFIKRLYFRDDETAMQLHVPPAEHISHPPGIVVHVLHLWRPQDVAIPRPPADMV